MVKMSSTLEGTEYGDFDILWKGALGALLEEDEENVGKYHNPDGNEDQTSDDLFNTLQASDYATSPSEDSPLKPTRRKMVKRIESDSEDDAIAATEDEDVPFVLDSDSDLEIVSEEWRPSCSTNTAALRARLLNSLGDSPVEITSCGDNNGLISQLPSLSRQTEFKAPALPLNPKYFSGRRPGLRPRNRSQSAQMNSSQSTDTPPATQAPDDRCRRVPVSIEEELIGEGDVCSSSDDEEYEQRVNGALIEREAQCSDEEEEEGEDGELEQSFINDQTIMSQQLSQDSMQGVYLQSIRQTWW